MAVTLFWALLLAPPPPEDPAPWVGNLGHARYAVREHASRKLVALRAVGALRQATRSPDPETAKRAEAALTAVVDAEVERLRPLPELDAAWRDCDRHVYDYGHAPPAMYAVLRASLDAPCDAAPWAAYYRACEWWVRARLGEGMSPALLRLILADLHRRDADFLGRAGDVGRALVVDAAAYARAGR